MRVSQTFFSKFKKRCHFSFSRSLEFGTLELPEIYTLRERVVARTDRQTDGHFKYPRPRMGKTSLSRALPSRGQLASLVDGCFLSFFDFWPIFQNFAIFRDFSIFTQFFFNQMRPDVEKS